jgi:hypothetical protein
MIKGDFKVVRQHDRGPAARCHSSDFLCCDGIDDGKLRWRSETFVNCKIVLQARMIVDANTRVFIELIKYSNIETDSYALAMKIKASSWGSSPRSKAEVNRGLK